VLSGTQVPQLRGTFCPHYQDKRESIPIQLVNPVTAAPNFVKDKVHPRTSHEGPMGTQRRRSTISLTSALHGGGWSTPRHATAALPLGKRAGTHCTRGWMGGREEFAPTGIRSPDRPARPKSLYRLSYPGPRSNLVLDITF